MIASSCQKNIDIKPDVIIRTPCVLQDTLPDSVGQWHIDTFSLPNGLNNRDLCFVNKQVGFLLKDQLTLFKTINAGKTWLEIARFNDFGSQGKAYFINENIGFISAAGVPNARLKATVDGGLTWENRLLPINGSVQQIHFTDNTNGIALVSRNNVLTNQYEISILRTQNQGRSWSVSPMTDTFNISKLHLFNNNKIVTFTTNNNRVYTLKSLDGGQKWTQLGEIPVSYMTDFWFTDELNGIAVSYNQFFTTDDGGLTWQQRKDIQGNLRIVSAGQSKDLLMISETEQCFHGDYFTYQGQFLSFENNTIVRSRNVTNLFFYITSFTDNTFGYGIKRNKLYRFER